jgi:hypothetical protein
MHARLLERLAFAVLVITAAAVLYLVFGWHPK